MLLVSKKVKTYFLWEIKMPFMSRKLQSQGSTWIFLDPGLKLSSKFLFPDQFATSLATIISLTYTQKRVSFPSNECLINRTWSSLVCIALVLLHLLKTLRPLFLSRQDNCTWYYLNFFPWHSETHVLLQNKGNLIP